MRRRISSNSLTTRKPIPPRMIRAMMVRLTSGSFRKPIRLSLNRAKPALQNAETE